MKIRFLLIMLFCSLGSLSTAQTTEQLWNDANTAYINGQYADAVRGYEAILNQGMESAKLYLNLGNAYYKQGLIGKAILEYNRALRLSPSDADARYNLAIAHAYVQDKIDVVPTFFLKRWVHALQSSCSGSGWAIWSVLFFAVAIGCIILYLLAEGLSWRKGGFYGAIGAILLFAFSFASAARSKRMALHPQTAIVMSNAAPVKSSPDSGSKDIFVLHEGTQVTVRDSLGDYREIMIADGNQGWIQASAIEMID